MKPVRIASFLQFLQKSYRMVGDMVTGAKVIVKMLQLSLIFCLLIYCSVYFSKVYEFIARVLNQEYQKTKWDILIGSTLYYVTLVAKVYILLVVLAFLIAVPYDSIFRIVKSLRTEDSLYSLCMMSHLLKMLFLIVFIHLSPAFGWFGFSNKVKWLQKMRGM